MKDSMKNLQAKFGFFVGGGFPKNVLAKLGLFEDSIKTSQKNFQAKLGLFDPFLAPPVPPISIVSLHSLPVLIWIT